MHTPRALITLSAASAVALLGASCASQPSSEDPASESVVHLSADYPEYGSTEAALEAADVVVVGTVESSRDLIEYPEINDSGAGLENPQSGVEVSNEDLEAMAVVTTVTTIRVSEVISGDAEVGDSVEVSQLGGTSEGVTYIEDSTTFIEEVDSPEVLLLLNDFGEGRYDLVNPIEGIYGVSDGEFESLPGVDFDSEMSSLEEVREFTE